MSEMVLKRDEIWESFLGTETPYSFQKNMVHSFRFKKEVHEEVVKSYEVVEKLLIHSYSEYDFLDPALTKCLSSFEMALRFRYKEVEKKKWGGNLQPLMQWFNRHGYFEFECQALLDAIRNRRNAQAHPKNYSGGAIGLMRIFTHCNSLINDLYEDLLLRKKRIEEEGRLRAFFESVRQNGAMATLFGIKERVYDINIFFIDNKSEPNRFYGYFKKTFDIVIDDGKKKLSHPFLFFFEADQCIYQSNNSVVFYNNGSPFISVEKELTGVESKAYEKWRINFFSDEYCLPLDMQANQQIDEEWYARKNEFHFQS